MSAGPHPPSEGGGEESISLPFAGSRNHPSLLGSGPFLHLQRSRVAFQSLSLFLFPRRLLSPPGPGVGLWWVAVDREKSLPFYQISLKHALPEKLYEDEKARK